MFFLGFFVASGNNIYTVFVFAHISAASRYLNAYTGYHSLWRSDNNFIRIGINVSLQVGHEKNSKKAEELNKKENAQKNKKGKEKKRWKKERKYVSAQENIGKVLSLPTIHNTPRYEAANTKQKQE